MLALGRVAESESRSGGGADRDGWVRGGGRHRDHGEGGEHGLEGSDTWTRGCERPAECGEYVWL